MKVPIELRKPFVEMLGVCMTCVFAVLVAWWAGKMAYAALSTVCFMFFI